MGSTYSASCSSGAQDWQPGAGLIGESSQSARTTSGDIAAKGNEAQRPRRADH